MKIGTHIDLIEPNNFCTACHGLRPTGSRLFYCFPLGFFFFFFDYPGIFGGLNMVNTLENVYTHWNLRPLGCRRGWDPGVAQRLYSAPWNTIRKLDEYLTHTCTYSYETWYTYRSHRAKQLLCHISWAPPNRMSASDIVRFQA